MREVVVRFLRELACALFDHKWGDEHGDINIKCRRCERCGQTQHSLLLQPWVDI